MKVATTLAELDALACLLSKLEGMVPELMASIASLRAKVA